MKKRITLESMGYFNLARGIGMVIIIGGHSANIFFDSSRNMQTGIQSAGSILGGGIMAMFFLISGYQFYKRSFKKCLSIQKKNLLYPYWLTFFCIIMTKFFLSVIEKRPFMEHGGEYILTALLGLNAEHGAIWKGIPIESVSIFWFVLALFGGWVIYNYVLDIKNKYLQWGILIGCLFLSWGLSLVAKVWIFCLPLALLAVFFLAMGEKIRKYHLLERRLPVWSYFLMGGLLIFCGMFGQVDMVVCQWKLGPIDMMGSLCCGFLLLRLYCKGMEKIKENRIISFLESIGFYSMWIICFHCYEKIIFPWYRLKSLFILHPVMGTMVCLMLRSMVMFGMFKIVSPVLVRMNVFWKKSKRRWGRR